MIVSRGRGYIFVHIPKTGGTSLALALEARAMKDDILIGDTPKARRRRRRLAGIATAGRLWKHSRLRDLPGLVEESEMAGMFVFTLVRNPFERAASYYYWLRAQRFSHPAVARARALPFDAFVRHPGTLAGFASSPYRSHVTLPTGGERCDVFIRLEHLAEDLVPVEERLGFRLDIPHENRSARPRDWRSLYSDAAASALAEACASDIRRFDYRFD